MENLSVIIDPARAFLFQVAAYLPRVGIAIVILIVGWLIAKAVRFGVVKALRAINFHILTQRAGIDGFLQRGGTEKDATDMIGVLFYWVVILIALIIAFNGLGLFQVTDLLLRVVYFIPKVLVALLVITFGSYFGRFVGTAVTTYCSNIGLGDADLLGRIAHYAIVVFVVLIAIDQLDLGGALVQNTFLILLAGLVLGLALAFGLGARDRASDLLDRWWPRRN